jgi:hypothetical protein
MNPLFQISFEDVLSPVIDPLDVSDRVISDDDENDGSGSGVGGGGGEHAFSPAGSDDLLLGGTGKGRGAIHQCLRSILNLDSEPDS